MFFDKDLEGIYILLGKSCDLNCSYCFQGDSHEKYVDEKINPDIIDFIRDLVSQQNTTKKFVIKFFGGEPLLYFDKIKYIVEQLQDIGHLIDFWVLTNGKRLNEEMVDFFNTYFPSIGVSWDGEGSIKSRGYDVVKDKRALLLKLKHVSFSTVFHRYNYPMDFYNQFITFLNEFTEIHKFPCNFVSAPITDCGNDDPLGLKYMDLNRVREESMDIYRRFRKTFTKSKTDWTYEDRFISFHLIESVEQIIKDSKTSKRKLGSDRIEMINMDLQGNLYMYHEFYGKSKFAYKLGDVYMNFFDYCKKSFATDKTELCMDKFGCDNCAVNQICRDKVSPNQKEDIKKILCDTTRALYEPTICLIEDLLHTGGCLDD